MAYTSPSVAASGLSGFAAYAGAGVNGTLEALIASNLAPNLNPTAAPTGAAASGGTLPNATYFVTVTETDGAGETTNGGQVSAGIAANAQKITVTFQALKAGNVARDVYIGTSAGGPFMLAGTGITTSTFDITALPANSWASIGPPALNSTGIVSDGNPAKMQAIRSVARGNFGQEWSRLGSEVSAFYRGDPVSWQGIIQKVRNLHTAVALYGQLLAELGSNIDANAGTIKPSQTPIGTSKLGRTQP